MPYQAYIRQHIFQPLGMINSRYAYNEVPPGLLAHGYRWIYGQWREEPLMPDAPDGSWGAMGGLLSSVEDFSAYMALHLQAWPPSDAPDTGPLSRSSIREMQHPWRFTGVNLRFAYQPGVPCPTASAYAYGLRWTQDCKDRIYIDHSGGLPGFGTQWRIMPDYGIGVVAFGNRTYSPMGGINFQVLDTLVKGAQLEPRPVPVSAILQQRQQELAGLLPNWTAAQQTGIFAENFFDDNPIDLLQRDCRVLFAKAGKIVRVHPMRAQNRLRGTFILEGEKVSLEVYFTLSPENPPLIQEFRIREMK
jgi:CubicO group peptidase (beta-lactamase class C family)